VAGYVAVCVLLLVYGRPGLGIGELFFVPIALVAVARGRRAGVVAGAAAAVLYAGALLVRSALTWSDIAGPRIAIHVVSYVAVGAIVGWFAGEARGLLADSLRMLDELLELGRRDHGTGVLDPRGIDGRLADKLKAGAPFVVLLGELGAEPSPPSGETRDAAVREAVRRLCSEFEDDVEVGRTGPTRLMLLAGAATPAKAHDAAFRAERALAETGRATFGWAFFPADGRDTLSLQQAASERLYARRIVRGEWTPTAASAGLVAELAPRSRPSAR